MTKKAAGKNMVKMAGLLGAVLALGLLSGCVTNKGMFDKTIPEEQQATLELPASLTVTSFDGTKVSWKVGFFLARWWGLGKVVVKIPSGKHDLTADYWVYKETYSGSSVTQQSQSADDLTVTFEFRPGGVYEMYPSTSGGYVSLAIREKAVK
ncbi:MAG: hypothetical protein LBQ55_01935 [Treponema sp.]|jgi:hypothetical protein|nr:hypothetical protein [Treponema sp.]